MEQASIMVTDIGVGPLPNGAQGATLVINLNNGSSIPVFLVQDQARELATQILNVINPRFPKGRLPDAI